MLSKIFYHKKAWIYDMKMNLKVWLDTMHDLAKVVFTIKGGKESLKLYEKFALSKNIN